MPSMLEPMMSGAARMDHRLNCVRAWSLVLNTAAPEKNCGFIRNRYFKISDSFQFSWYASHLVLTQQACLGRSSRQAPNIHTDFDRHCNVIASIERKRANRISLTRWRQRWFPIGCSRCGCARSCRATYRTAQTNSCRLHRTIKFHQVRMYVCT